MADPRQSEATRTETPVVETATRARAGSTPGVTRNVLVFGTLLVVVIFAVLFLVGSS
jgi:hypothetical protein